MKEKFLDDSSKVIQSLQNITKDIGGLYLKGNVELLESDKRRIAVIGSRTPTRLGESTAYQLAKLLSDNNIVLSGCAPGIDAFAHKGCLESGGDTIAVLPCGYDSVAYDETEGLQRRIIERGLLISEYHPSVEVNPSYYEERDLIQAALADVVILVESEIEGGAMKTINFAKQYGKRILVLDYSQQHPVRTGNAVLIDTGSDYLVPEDIEAINQLISK